MTHSIRGLIVDDSPKNLSSVTTRLNHYLGAEGWTIEWTEMGDPDSAHEVLRGSSRFDLVVVDLLFDRPDMDGDEARGLELIESARAASRHSFIFAISNGDTNRHDLFSEAGRRGADRVVRRAEFSVESVANGPKAIAAAIRAHLLDNGTVTEVRVEAADPNDPAVQALLFEVKSSTLAQLHRQVLAVTSDTTDNISVRFLSPGASGASVCETTSNLGRGRVVRHVIKVSRASDDLATEAERALHARQLLQSRFVVTSSPEYPVGPVNGWYATGSATDKKVVTLRKWLSEGPGPEVTDELFEVLFTECLGPLYAGNLETKDVDPLSLFKIRHYKQRLVLQAIDELLPTLSRPDGGGLTTVEGIRDDLIAFVTEARLNGVLARQVPRTTQATHVHGDLHGGNILLYQGKHPAPALIDFRYFGEAHWAVDVARLAVDLLMRIVDSGAESMFFTGFDTWRRLAAKIGVLSTDLSAVTSDPATTAALTGLRWITAHLREVCPPIATDEGFETHHWEWHVALCTYLLRITYHYEVPGPKRALAVVAAHDQLRAGVAELKRLGHRR
ncbi:hypothetical protein GCM10009634_86300 [Saccharothrix xinjiangensis]